MSASKQGPRSMPPRPDYTRMTRAGSTRKINCTFGEERAVDLTGAEHKLLERGGRYRTLFDLAPVAVYTCDACGVVRDFNNRAAELWDRKPARDDTDERFCGSFKMFRPDGSFMPHEQCPMVDVLSGRIPWMHDTEVQIKRPDGSRIVVIVNIAPLTGDRGKIRGGAINCFYNIPERKHAEAALRNSIAECRRAEEALRKSEGQLRVVTEELESAIRSRTAMLRHLSVQLMRSQDDERRRIARNLHDSLGQYLVSIKMNLDLLLPSALPSQTEALVDALRSVEHSIAETRTVSCLLHPPLLDEVGFASAARWFSAEFAKRSGIEVRLDLPGDMDRLPELTEIAMFRILQESLTNVHRHSGSPTVEIGLSISRSQARLRIQDFGRGMPARMMQTPGLDPVNLGVGLSGMRERIADLGGTFEIESDSHGTALIVVFPLAPRPSGESLTTKANFAKKSVA